MTDGGDQPDLLSDLTDLDFARLLLAEMHDDLHGKVSRFRMLIDFSREIRPKGAMIFGGQAAHHAWLEARTSFVHGNFVATVLLCQGLVEHLLAAYLPIPTKPPLCSDLIAPPDSEMISPPGAGALLAV